MLKTIAKIKYRFDVPDYAIATKRFYVNFYGFRAKEMKRKWSAIKYERYEQFNPIYEENEKKIEDMREAADIFYRRVEELQPFYRLWHTKKEKAMLHAADDLINKAYQLEQENKKILHNMFLDDDEAESKLQELLQQNGFFFTQISYRRVKAGNYIALWTLEESF